jgi:CheY-like chemotaxis protein
MRHPYILIVEDDYSIRESVKQLLEMEGFEATVVAHGQEALDLLRSETPLPALILLDWTMPVMNGAEFLAVRKQDPILHEIPVLVFTAIGVPIDTSQATGIVKKPIDADDLVNSVTKFVSPATPPLYASQSGATAVI